MNMSANASVHDALTKAIATLGETGLQVAAYHHGELVVDTWAGVADPETGRAVDGDTLFTVFSMSKGVTATITHRLVERGILAYDEPLATWWPAFAAHGKGGITLRHALSHRAGLPGFKGLAFADQPSLAATGRNLEEATPDWAPGASMAYHGMTFGTLLGRTIELATGKPFAQVLHEEVTGPANIPDLWCGIPADPSIHARVATLHPGNAPDSSTGLRPMDDAERATLTETSARRNRPEFREGCMPAGGMIGSARAFARHYASMRSEGLDGTRLLDPATIAHASVAYFGDDGKHIAWTNRMGLGYALGAGTHQDCGVTIVAPWADAFGHTGLGGSLAMYCPSQDLAVAMTKNALHPGRLECFTWDLALRAVCEGLGIAYHA
ncbi:MAG: beta-lactamase family protein [Chloroflexi bacterium]|nr:beta-lactamase family protein [Chloroflexota bacterium]